MKTYIIKESEIQGFYDSVTNVSKSESEELIRIGLLGLNEIELDVAKKIANVGDCLLLKYNCHFLPFQIIDKTQDGDCVMNSRDILETHIFDKETNVWKDSEIRHFMNENMINNFDRELVERIKPTEIKTDNYTTTDKLWLLSHEEVGYYDDSDVNSKVKTFEYYK